MESPPTPLIDIMAVNIIGNSEKTSDTQNPEKKRNNSVSKGLYHSETINLIIFSTANLGFTCITFLIEECNNHCTRKKIFPETICISEPVINGTNDH